MRKLAQYMLVMSMYQHTEEISHLIGCKALIHARTDFMNYITINTFPNRLDLCVQNTAVTTKHLTERS